MWTPASCAQHSRQGLRYPFDLTDAEWVVIASLLTLLCRMGRPRKWFMREVLNAIFYILRTGCPWAFLPESFPPEGTVRHWFRRFRDEGAFERMARALGARDHERAGREASPSAAIMDSQSVKLCKSGGPRGYDGGKKVVGRERHALVDTDGRLLIVGVTPASVQDRDAAGPLVRTSRSRFPFVKLAYAAQAIRGKRCATPRPSPCGS